VVYNDFNFNFFKNFFNIFLNKKIIFTTVSNINARCSIGGASHHNSHPVWQIDSQNQRTLFTRRRRKKALEGFNKTFHLFFKEKK
jgi:hypothetical protein